MEALFRRNDEMLKDTSLRFVRSIIDDIPWSESRLNAIRGARGVGKTTLMLQYQKLHYGNNENHKSLYIRLDNAYFAQHNLVDVAEQFYRQGGELLLVDEVHNAQYWAKEIKENADVATKMLRDGTEPEYVLKYISTSTRVANNNDLDLYKRHNTGILRIEREGWHSRECDIFTPYDGQKYKTYAERLVQVNSHPLKDPYSRQISLSRPANLFTGKIFHGSFANVNIALDYVFKLCNDIFPKFVKNDIKPKDLPELNSKIAEMRWVLAHSTPWIRGSDAISNIFMRSIYKAVGVKTYPIKKGVSLDLEAYCTNLDEYQKQWTKYFDKAPEIVE